MDDLDPYPVRDDPGGGPAKKKALDADAARQRAQVSRWSRDELEDKYLRVQDENLILKRHCRKQEDKIKKMAVKLLRLVADKKKVEARPRNARDVDFEEKLNEMQDKVRHLEREKGQLEEKLMVAKQHLTVAASSHKNATYGKVQSRINTGVPKKNPRLASQMRVAGPMPSAKGGKGQGASQKLPRYGHSLLEEARDQIQYLEELVAQRDEQINICEQDAEMMREEMKMKEHEFEEDLLKIKQQSAGSTRANLQENIDLIRLQREVKDKATKLTSTMAKYEELNQKMLNMKEAHANVMDEMERLTSQLKAEQGKVLALKSQPKRDPSHEAQKVELEERVNDLKRENEILKESNEKLVSSAFDMERERDWRQRENALKVQIAQLEATLKADLGEKGTILDRLTAEREANEKKDKEHREMMREFYKLKEQYDELKEKMKFFTKESAVDFTEIEEALVLVKQRKEKGEEDLGFLGKVEDEKGRDYEKALITLQADHAETIEELEKTRNMLLVQHQINRDYQAEVEAATKKLHEDKTEYELKLDEYAQLLDIRAARIRKLESQLKDVAYGTRQYRVKADDEPMGSDVDEIDETLHLERGQNLFEIHITKLHLTNDGLRQIGDDDPSIFCTWEFYEFETQATPIVKGPNPQFEFTSQYIVKVDDFFLHYLQKESVLLEIHQALGMDYRTVATCRLRFRDIFDKSQGRLHGSVKIMGIDDRTTNFGSIDFWVRLKVPMDQALRLYKERTKALGYLSANDKTDESKPLDESADMRAPDNINELTIKIQRVNKVMSNRKDVQPSPYCIYKFYEFSDHDSPIVPNTNSPEFNDVKSFPVPMVADLDHYLKTTALTVFVFDDCDPELTSYLGRATIPLMPLAHDKSIKGVFELRRADDTVNGTLELFLKWSYSYLPPAAATMTPAQVSRLSASASASKRAPLPLMEGEQYTEDGKIEAAPATSEEFTQVKVARKEQLARDKALLTSPVRRASHPEYASDSETRVSRDSDLEMTPTKLQTAKKTVEFNMEVGGVSSPQRPRKQGEHQPSPPSALKRTLTTTGQGHEQMIGKERASSTESAASAIVAEQTPEVSSKLPPAAQAESVTSSVAEPPEDLAKAPSPPPVKVIQSKPKAVQEDAPVEKSVSQSVVSDASELVTVSQSESESPVAAPADGVNGQPAEEDDDSDSTVTITPDSTREIQEPVPSAPKPKPRLSEESATSSSKKKQQKVTLGATGSLRKKKRHSVKSSVEDETDEEEERVKAVKAALEKSSMSDPDKSLDTQFGDDEDEDSIAEEIEEEEDDPLNNSHDDSSVADSEGVVSPEVKRPLSALSGDIVVIQVSHLSLEDGSPPMVNESVTRLFVAYTFLDFPVDELETPTSLPKPRSSRDNITFNFQKVFHIDTENNVTHRQYLASMLLKESPDQGRLCFTVVSEPAEEDKDCIDVGVAYLSLPQILTSKVDCIDRDIDILDVDDEKTIIGTLNVTVECLQALQTISQEMGP